jgi:Galactose oxidase, central domain/Kelch motif
LANATGLGPVGRKPLEVRVLSPALALAVLALVASGRASGGTSSGWRVATPLPVARTEVTSARLGNEIAVIGGFLADGTSTGRTDAYSPETGRWRRLPDLPVKVNHAMAASVRGNIYVVGGYGAERSAFVFRRGRWHRLRSLPAPRAAGGAAVVGRRLYVVGGAVAPGKLAPRMLMLDLRTGRWSFAPGPSPREHLAVTTAGGIVYALAGRSAGTNFTTFEAYSPARRVWSRLLPVPYPRGGTGAAIVGGRIVSVGGEESAGTIPSVYSYDVAARRWTRLPDMRTPRHGLAVAAFGGSVYAIAGGPQPGLHVSAANEFLTLR